MNFERLDEAKETKKGILASYKATFMEFNKVNENNRIYSSDIAKNRILTNDTKQAIKENKLLGEINHPKERFDVDYEKVCINTTSLYYDEATDSLKGTFDILDTPMGRILNTLVEYGTHISLSARAMGKTKTGKNGVNEVMEDSYMFKTFDAVTTPGFSIATIDPSKDSINESLCDLYESFTEDEKAQVSPLLESIGMPKDFLYSSTSPQDNVDNANIDNNELISEDKSDMQNLIAEYEAIIDILKSQLSDKDANIKAIKDEYSAIIDVIQTSNQDKVDSLSDKIDEYKKALEVYSLSLQSSNTKINNLTNELTEANATVESLKSELKMVYESFNNRINELTTVNESMQSDMELYSTEVNTSNDNYNSLLEEHKQLEAKYIELLNSLEKDRFELQDNSIYEGETNITLVNVITESKEDSRQVDALTLNLLNKINNKK